MQNYYMQEENIFHAESLILQHIYVINNLVVYF